MVISALSGAGISWVGRVRLNQLAARSVRQVILEAFWPRGRLKRRPINRTHTIESVEGTKFLHQGVFSDLPLRGQIGQPAKPLRDATGSLGIPSWHHWPPFGSPRLGPGVGRGSTPVWRTPRGSSAPLSQELPRRQHTSHHPNPSCFSRRTTPSNS